MLGDNIRKQRIALLAGYNDIVRTERHADFVRVSFSEKKLIL